MPTAEVNDSAPCSAAKSRTKARGDGLMLIGGVLNGKAISKPAPIYPAAARAAQVSGTVVVQVKIDECGNVVSAEAISGDPLLRQAAVDSAMKWRFPPTRLSGQPVKVSGTVTFNFLLQ
jgi:protein TonB